MIWEDPPLRPLQTNLPMELVGVSAHMLPFAVPCILRLMCACTHLYILWTHLYQSSVCRVWSLCAHVNTCWALRCAQVIISVSAYFSSVQTYIDTYFHLISFLLLFHKFVHWLPHMLNYVWYLQHHLVCLFVLQAQVMALVDNNERTGKDTISTKDTSGAPLRMLSASSLHMCVCLPQTFFHSHGLLCSLVCFLFLLFSR